MKLEEFQRVSKNVKTVISKFRENPGKFTAIVLQMYWDIKAERDTCLEDIEKLREENRNLKEIHEAQTNYNCKLLEEIDELDRKYNTLTNHIRMKAEANPGVSRYIDLVNYIDRLERADDER